MPRRSAADIEAKRRVVIDREPPEPPPELRPDEQEIWRGICGAVRPDWFGADTMPLLVELCRHGAYARELAFEIGEVRAELKRLAPPWDLGQDRVAASSVPVGADELKQIRWLRTELYALLRAHGYQSERIGNLATKLRLTNQARYSMKIAKTADAISAPEPWEGFPIDALGPLPDEGRA